MDLGWAVVRPSLVVGRGGGSTALFSALAALPLMPDIGGGMVQPIAIDDLVEAIWRLLQRPCPWRWWWMRWGRSRCVSWI
jgi:uncharacterized protein YbjT (DUF2867 family)